MKKIIIPLLIISLILLSGCVKKEESSICNKPYLEYMQGQCCLDSNNNQICDKDEIEKVEEVKEELEPKPIESAEIVARRLATTWEMGEYEQMYEFFTSDLKQKKTVTEFAYIIEESKIEDETYSVRLDELSLIDETTALAYFHINGYSIFQAEMPALHMRLKDGKWLFDAFGIVFDAECTYRPKFRFSECPFTEECSLECAKQGILLHSSHFGESAKYTYELAFPLCNKLFKCECRCIDIRTLEETCSITKYPSQSKQDIKDRVCTKWSNSFKKALNIQFEEYDDKITIRELEAKALTSTYVFIDNDYVISIGTVNPKEIKTIYKKDVKHKETGSSYTEKYLDKIYIYSDQGRYFYGSYGDLNTFKFTYTSD